jgi:hypothetical protein
VEYLFNNLYPTLLILHRGRIRETIAAIDQSLEAYCTIASLCAYVLFQPAMVLPPHDRLSADRGQVANHSLAHHLLDETIRVRKGYEFSENPTVLTVYTSLFISNCYFGLDQQNPTWVYLRQATTLAHVVGLHEEHTYKNDDFIGSSRKRRLFWLLFITERYLLQS